MNPDTAWLLYLLGSFLLAVVAMAFGAVLGRLNRDRDETAQQRIADEQLPIMLRHQAD